jgi:hypothetical protein
LATERNYRAGAVLAADKQAPYRSEELRLVAEARAPAPSRRQKATASVMLALRATRDGAGR